MKKIADSNNAEQPPPLIGKVLLVEDQIVYSKLLLMYLSQFGISCISATAGREALKILSEENDIDLVILDLMLPDMIGFDVCRKIREKYSLFDLPVLLLTAADDVNDKVVGFSVGANDFLSKPYDKNELLARAKTLIHLKKIAQHNIQLKEALERENRYHRMTVHDIKNPLTSIIALSSFMKDELGPSFEHNETVDIIIRSSEKILSMLADFLEMARIESGNLSLNCEPIDINEIATQVNEGNLPNANQKSQKIIFTPGPKGKCIINGDSGRLQQIFDNLLSNAVKYSPLGEKIYTTVSFSAENIESPIVRYEVIDNGPGFSEADSKKLFGKFQKLSSIPTAGESSTGLGLSIAKELVEMHKGKIWAESIQGKGSRFIVEISALSK